MNSDKGSNLKNNQITCKVCGKEFSNSNKFQVHKKCHTKNDRSRNLLLQTNCWIQSKLRFIIILKRDEIKY